LVFTWAAYGAGMTIGTEVEVQTRYTGAWARGFTLAAVQEEGCIIRRASDGVVLPAPIPAESVRACRPT
jgi:hypothetical protein